MNENSGQMNIEGEYAADAGDSFNYSYVDSVACIAVYDNLKSAPRIIRIEPSPTNEYIEALSSKVYEQAKMAGGDIPYTAIREVSENYIHAKFSEIVVSILDSGNTIRFSDQGPGISEKEKVKLPGFTSAVEPMKRYIRGVGSGLPIVKEYLDFSAGTITIEDNVGTGAVITISLKEEKKAASSPSQRPAAALVPPLSNREREILILFSREGALGVTDIVNITGYPPSSTHVNLTRLEEYGLVEKTAGQKRILTDLGYTTAENLK